MGKYQSGDFLPASINRNYNKYRERERERESNRYMIAAKYVYTEIGRGRRRYIL